MPGIPKKYKDIISQLTIEEKVSLLSGANFWNTKAIERVGIPSIMMTDGPHGLRKQGGKADHLGLNQSVPATCFPTAAALANSWDPLLTQAVGAALGAEAAYNDVQVVLGPGLNIIRDPLAGRAFEYFSEDPLLAGELAAGEVRGIQSRGVGATVKHYAVNSQEYLRMSIDEVVDERTLREIYLEGFRRVVQGAKPKAIMTAYNKINGVYANEHPHLLQDILFNEWGYKGMPVTDWGGMNDPVAAVRTGAVLEMPTSHGISDKELLDALLKGHITENEIDERVASLLKLVFTTKEATKHPPKVDYAAHHALAVRAATESIVLLKNNAMVTNKKESATPILPLKTGVGMAVLGDFAETPRYQGAGSSLVNPTQVTNALHSFDAEDTVQFIGYAKAFERSGRRSASEIARALDLARHADVTVVFLGLDEAKESEGIDRQTMSLPRNQLELMAALKAERIKNIVVVLSAGGPVELPFNDDVAAIVHSFLGGQGSGKAIVDILLGHKNPSGKLAVSYPVCYKDAPTAKYFPGRELTAEHREGLYVGYRYYETTGVEVRYPFGHGLSYTQFAYSGVKVTRSKVSFTVRNTGAVTGSEIAQVYVRPLTPIAFRPARELKGFAKLTLAPNTSRHVEIDFDEHTFAHYSVEDKAWIEDPGEYEIEISSSVKDVRLKATIKLIGNNVSMHRYKKKKLPSYYSGHVRDVSDHEYAELLGRPLPPALWDRKAKLTYYDTVAQLAYGRFSGRVFLGLLHFARRALFAVKKPNAANNIVFIMNMTFSKFPRFTNNKPSEKFLRRYLRDKK